MDMSVQASPHTRVKRHSFNTESASIGYNELQSVPEALLPNPIFCLSHYRWVWLYFFLLGTINNFAYVVVLSSAASLARSFDQSSLIGLIAWANVAFGIIFKFLNTTEKVLLSSGHVLFFVISYCIILVWSVPWYVFQFVSTPHSTRLAICTTLMVIGLVVVSLSVYISFYVAIAGIVFIGIFSSWGERYARFLL